MTREGEGMQVPCILHFKGHKKSIDIFKKLNWIDPFSVMQRKTIQGCLKMFWTTVLSSF